MVRGKYLPQILGEERSIAYWTVLLDSATDQSHLQHFVQNFPPSCRFYGLESQQLESQQLLPLNRSQDLKIYLMTMLDTVINHAVRSVAPVISPTTISKRPRTGHEPVKSLAMPRRCSSRFSPLSNQPRFEWRSKQSLRVPANFGVELHANIVGDQAQSIKDWTDRRIRRTHIIQVFAVAKRFR